MMNARCPLCGAELTAPKQVRGGSVARCRSCSALTTLPRLADAELAELYDDAYFEDRLAASLRDDADVENALVDHAARAAFLSVLHPPGRVLDVGGATGLFAASAGRFGWQAAMVEASPTASDWAHRRLNVEVLGASLADVNRDRRFDAVTFWHSLEHHADPVFALQTVRRLLEPGGIVIIEAPNAASLDRRVAGRHWSGWHLPFHTIHLTPRALVTAALQAGLRPERLAFAPFGALASPARAVRAAVWRHYRTTLSGPNPAPRAPLILRQSPRASRALAVLSGREMLLVARR